MPLVKLAGSMLVLGLAALAAGCIAVPVGPPVAVAPPPVVIAPAPVVSEVKTGHVVFVTVSVIDTRVATVTGSIAAVDRAKGTATVATPGGSFTLTPSSAALDGMKPGDDVLLKLGLVDVGPPA